MSKPRDIAGSWRERLHFPAVALVISLLSGAAVYFLRATGSLFLFEARLADWMTLHTPHADPRHSPVAIVQLSERDIRTGGFPISDRRLNELLQRLLAVNARAIGIDIYRDLVVPDARPGSDPVADRAALIDTIRRNRRIFLIYLNAAGDERVEPPPELAGAPNLTLSRVILDPDGRARRSLLFSYDDVTGMVVPNLATAVAQRYLRAEGIQPAGIEGDPQAYVLGKATLRFFDPTWGYYGRWLRTEIDGQQMPLDYLGPMQFERHDVQSVLTDDAVAARFADRIALIGVIARSNKDLIPTPLADDTPGVEFHAHAAEQLIRAARTGLVARRVLPEGTETLYILISATVGAALAVLIRSQLRMFPLLLLLLIGVVGTGWVAFRNYSLVPVIPPMTAMVLSNALTTGYVALHQRRERQTLMSLFGKTVSPAVARELWRQRGQLLSAGRLQPREMVATVLFFDLKGFTAISEQTSPGTMISLLNELFEELATTIEAHGGVVNKFVGDQILALFGPPLPRNCESHYRADATAAVRCALELRRKLVAVNEAWARQGRPR
ncbi:MAG: adenylate/guanylate cyclase domain-containing protein, partial [Phycisphaerae bacterium]|nr:adenylate/guanylate cyclase domain-containing protein [Phycisphaerae bacterium]